MRRRQIAPTHDADMEAQTAARVREARVVAATSAMLALTPDERAEVLAQFRPKLKAARP